MMLHNLEVPDNHAPRTLIVGSTSRLAQAFSLRLGDANQIKVERNQVSRWLASKDFTYAVREDLRELPGPISDITIFSAITDNSADLGLMRKVNIELPLAIARAVEDTNIGVRTYGSVLEASAAESSKYLFTKGELASAVTERRNLGQNILHVRFHTLYGAGEPSNHMFLGQALNAIRNDVAFEMSSGTQIRQYQHVDDLLKAIELIFADNQKAIYEISHKENYMLKDIAESIFEHFKVPHLLRLGAIASHDNEVFTPNYLPDEVYSSVQFRPTLNGLNDYLHGLIVG